MFCFPSSDTSTICILNSLFTSSISPDFPWPFYLLLYFTFIFLVFLLFLSLSKFCYNLLYPLGTFQCILCLWVGFFFPVSLLRSISSYCIIPHFVTVVLSFKISISSLYLHLHLHLHLYISTSNFQMFSWAFLVQLKIVLAFFWFVFCCCCLSVWHNSSAEVFWFEFSVLFFH